MKTIININVNVVIIINIDKDYLIIKKFVL